MAAPLLSLWVGGGRGGDRKLAPEYVGLRMVVNKCVREQRRTGQGSGWDWTWTQRAMVLATEDRVCVAVSREPGSRRGRGLGAQDLLPAPSVWRWPSLTAKPAPTLLPLRLRPGQKDRRTASQSKAWTWLMARPWYFS